MFHLSLEVPSDLAAQGNRISADDGDFASLVMEGCEVLSEAGCRFRMGGFGHDDWKLDVSYDLSTVIEQLPEVLAALRRGEQADLDLYAQGVERTITLVPDGDHLVLRCESRTSWTPDPDTERLPRDQVIALFQKLATDFANALADVEPLRRWRVGDL